MSKKACVLVCVTSQPDCERLIRAGKKIADGEGVPLQVVSVQRMEECFQPNSDTLERLHQQAKAVNAEMTIYFQIMHPQMQTSVQKQRTVEMSP